MEVLIKLHVLKKFIGKDFTVISSKGHVRDLPQKDLGIDIPMGFKPKYEILEEKKKLIQNIKKTKYTLIFIRRKIISEQEKNRIERENHKAEMDRQKAEIYEE